MLVLLAVCSLIRVSRGSLGCNLDFMPDLDGLRFLREETTVSPRDVNPGGNGRVNGMLGLDPDREKHSTACQRVRKLGKGHSTSRTIRRRARAIRS